MNPHTPTHFPGKSILRGFRSFVRRLRAEYAYRGLPNRKVRAWVQSTPEKRKRIKQELLDAGLNVVDLEIDPESYRRYYQKARYDRFEPYGENLGLSFREKTLQHYLAAHLLDLDDEVRLVDVASCNSPVPRIYSDLYGCEVWQQDLEYPQGVRDRTIGGDAAAMPVRDGFADRLSLHCSFEHFEGDADSRFVREAARVLKPGGKMCILPLYLNDTYAIQTDPDRLLGGGPPFEPDATIHAAENWRNRHRRFYDVPHFVDRVVKHLSGLKLTIHYVTNEKTIGPDCHLKFIAIFDKP